MLRVFDFSKKSIGVFDGYDTFLEFITSLENQNLLEGSPLFGGGYWAFAEFSPEKLKNVCAWIKPGFLTTVQLKALEQKLGLIEICRGNAASLQEVPVTSDLDVEEFKKKFCLDYCLQRRWRLIEVLDHKPSSNSQVDHYIARPYTRKMRLSQKSLENTQGRRMLADLNSCIGRLRQKTETTKYITAPTTTHKGEL